MFRNAENKTIAGMKKQIQELTDANEKWKCQVQEMRKQIVELTIVSQRREHRRSAQAKVTQNILYTCSSGKCPWKTRSFVREY